MSETTPLSGRTLYRLAYQFVRLMRYERETYEQWDYAHNPSDEEMASADASWSVVMDCRRQMDEIRPHLADHKALIQHASDHWLLRNGDPEKRMGRLPHLGNIIGICYSHDLPTRRSSQHMSYRESQYRSTHVWKLRSGPRADDSIRDRWEHFIKTARQRYFSKYWPEPPGLKLPDITGNEPALPQSKLYPHLKEERLITIADVIAEGEARPAWGLHREIATCEVCGKQGVRGHHYSRGREWFFYTHTWIQDRWDERYGLDRCWHEVTEQRKAETLKFWEDLKARVAAGDVPDWLDPETIESIKREMETNS